MRNRSASCGLHRLVRGAGLLLLFLGLLAATGWAGAPPARTLTVMDWDLQGAKGPLPVAQFDQLRALLMYTTPDIVALHTVLQEAGRSHDTALAQTALAMDMYYAYQPLDDRLGSALLSRYPILSADCMFDAKTQATTGMTVTVQIDGRPYAILVVRPPTAAVARTTAATVLAGMKAQKDRDYLVLASFGPALGAKQWVAVWTKAGAWDPFATLKKPWTFPFERPQDRLDFILLSPNLRAEYVRGEVLRVPRLFGLSEHLPVTVTLRR